MTQPRALLGALAFTLLTGCGFDAADVLEAREVSVSGEQVTVKPDQVICGEREGLWKIEQLSRGALGRLTPEAHALGFANDVRMGDPGFMEPYAQVSGSHGLKVAKITNVTDEGATTKTVSANAGVVIKHRCFDDPLPMHGVQRGRFLPNVVPRFQLKDQSGWTFDQILH